MLDDRRDDGLLHDDDHVVSPPRRNRGFWLVAGTMVLASVVVVVAIFANLGVKDTIAHAQHSLLEVQAAAVWERTQTGSFRGADATGLAAAVPELRLVGADTASEELDEVSILADGSVWAAAVEARPGACFFLRLDAFGDPSYGSGTLCTGREAERWATDTDW
jgi:hypothetical protein